jgi:hypothetical protein
MDRYCYVVFWAFDWDTMERQVHGAGPMLLHNVLGVSWERPNSLRSLMWTTRDAGGWDCLLMGSQSCWVQIVVILYPTVPLGFDQEQKVCDAGIPGAMHADLLYRTVNPLSSPPSSFSL